jgi:hypothetical protein
MKSKQKYGEKKMLYRVHFVIFTLLLSACTMKTTHYSQVALDDRNLIKENRLLKQEKPEESSLLEAFSYNKSKKIQKNAFALLIGIGNYMETSDVMYADHSAQAFATLLEVTFGLPKENIMVLINEKATSGQIKVKLEHLKELAEEDSNLYLFFAGHGVPGKDGETYLLPADMKADQIYLEKRLKIENIYKQLNQSSAKQTYLFLDTCFSGKDDSGSLLYEDIAATLLVKKSVVKGSKLTILTAGDFDDFANIYTQKGHRLFSYFLIDELAKGYNNIDDVYSHVRLQVKRHSIKKGVMYKQIPQLYKHKQIAFY